MTTGGPTWAQTAAPKSRSSSQWQDQLAGAALHKHVPARSKALRHLPHEGSRPPTFSGGRLDARTSWNLPARPVTCNQLITR